MGELGTAPIVDADQTGDVVEEPLEHEQLVYARDRWMGTI